MTNRHSAVFQTLVSLAILGAGVVIFLWLSKPEIPTQEPPPEQPPIVSVVPAVAHQDGVSFAVDGTVVPYREIELAAQVGGKVVFKAENCRTGKIVHQGEVLLRIEPLDYQLEVRRLTESLAQADAMILETDAEIQSLENQIESLRQQLVIDSRQLQRSTDLANRSAASSTEVDSARKTELTTSNTLQSLIDQKSLLTKRGVRMVSAKSLVEANLEQAQVDLQRTEIVSPIDGVVVSESVEQDGFVQAGGPIVRLQDTSRLDVICKLHMRQMNWLWQGLSAGSAGSADDDFIGGYDFPTTPATVICEIGDQPYTWKAVVDRYDGAGVDSQTRMVPCRVHVDDPTNMANQESEIASPNRSGRPPTLMTGMFVKVVIHSSPPIDMVRLPHQAIQPGKMVWSVDSGRLAKLKVTIANSTTNFVIAYQTAEDIASSKQGDQHDGRLNAGDLVVTSPMASPATGMTVRVEGNAENVRGPELRPPSHRRRDRSLSTPNDPTPAAPKPDRSSRRQTNGSAVR